MAVRAVQRSLDDWYRTINAIYLDRNFYRDTTSIFAHLVEVMGGLSLLASSKTKPGVKPREFVPKALAWWMALCGKVGVRSVEDMIWWKFPSVCSYCHLKPHRDDICIETKARLGTPDWNQLEQIGRANVSERPRTLGQWQGMFADIYPVVATEDYPATFARFTEELGELSEAVRVFPIAPGYFLSEAADVFAWLVHLQNIIHHRSGVLRAERGPDLERSFNQAYPDQCKDCGNPVCTCPPILPSTLGRIAHEVPAGRASFLEGGALLPAKEAMEIFELGTRQIRLGDSEFEVNSDLIRQIHDVVLRLMDFAVETQALAGAQSVELMKALRGIDGLTSSQRVTQESIDLLASAIARLPSDGRNLAISFLGSIAASASLPWLGALLDAVRRATGH